MNTDLKIAELADRTGFHVESLRRLARTGKLPGAYRLGGSWLIRSEAVEALRHGEVDAVCAGAVR